MQLTGDELKQRGLAGPARAHHRRHHTATDVEIEILEDDALAAAKTEATDLDEHVRTWRLIHPQRLRLIHLRIRLDSLTSHLKTCIDSKRLILVFRAMGRQADSILELVRIRPRIQY
jgi:hypothetical protein